MNDIVELVTSVLTGILYLVIFGCMIYLIEFTETFIFSLIYIFFPSVKEIHYQVSVETNHFLRCGCDYCECVLGSIRNEKKKRKQEQREKRKEENWHLD